MDTGSSWVVVLLLTENGNKACGLKCQCRVTVGTALAEGDAEETREFLNCRQHAASIEPMPGAFMPECNDAGHYRVKQCHGSTGECWCVNPISGQEIDGSRVQFDDPQCREGSACEQQVANIEVMPGAYVPTCDAESGAYARVQCHGSTGYCWCAHADTNMELPGTRVRFSQPDCPPPPPEEPSACEREASQRQVMLGAYIPQCEDDGSYSPMQCHGSTGHCWCVDPETNEEVAGTRAAPGVERPQCVLVLGRAAPGAGAEAGAVDQEEADTDEVSGSAVRGASVAGLGTLCLLLLLHL